MNASQLNRSVKNNDMDAVRTHLANGGDPDLYDDESGKFVTPLMQALLSYHIHMATMLLLMGADPNECGRAQFTAVQIAAAQGMHAFFPIFSGLGFDINVRLTHNRTPLHVAASCDHPKTVQVLLDLGADPLALDDMDMTPGIIALMKGFHQVAAVLGIPPDVAKLCSVPTDFQD